ncbi:glycosyltransferase family 4 protein, partial [Candidatus Beckwithbacteria bacterium]|nr:glycosyltransferase family 4 protein [Candidatus Beckwithbacteria bacterium]
MKILITNFRYLGFTGTETFIYSLLKFLRLNKINATFYSPFLGGEIVERTRRLGIKCVDNLEEIKNEQFDLIHCQQDLVAILSRFYFPKTPIVMLKHGFLTPIDTHSGLVQFNYYGGISHELVKIWEKEKIAKNRLFLFPNSVDLEKFSCFSPLPKIPQKLLVFNPRIDQKAKLIIKNVATKNHLAVKFLGLGKRIFNVEDRIKKADIVLTLGRAAYEAM